jgi:hypothetical protein
MVLDCVGAEEPVFSQGVLVDFRRRLVAHNMDKKFIERTVKLAEETGEFGARQLRVALDSAPLWGAGRVEDTFNLIGHALAVVVDCAAQVLDVSPEAVRKDAELKLLGGKSLKAKLDIDWDDPEQQANALTRLLADVQRLRAFVTKSLEEAAKQPPLKQALELLEKVIAQDLEPDPKGGMRIREGTAKDRRISVTDPDMRHGRKSRSRVINGYKRHVAVDLVTKLILAATVRPANEPEHRAADVLRPEIEGFGSIEEFHIDRGYLASGLARDLHDTGEAHPLQALGAPRTASGSAKPSSPSTSRASSSAAPKTSRPPSMPEKPSSQPERCDACMVRSQCTRARLGRGRSIAIHPRGGTPHRTAGAQGDEGGPCRPA